MDSDCRELDKSWIKLESWIIVAVKRRGLARRQCKSCCCVFWRRNCSLSDHQINGCGAGKSSILWNSISCVRLCFWSWRPPLSPFLAWAGAVVRPVRFRREGPRTTSWGIVHSALACQALTSSSEITSVRHPSQQNPYPQMIH